MRNHFIKRLCELAESNPRITLITGDLGFGVFNEYRERFPDQFINAGIAEQNMTGLATGLALEGRTVFTYSIGNFPTLRCLEQIRNDACYHNANVKIVSAGGGFSYGALGISHHSTEDLAILRSLPDITVLSPCGLWETMAATEAISSVPGTCYLRLDKSFGDDSPSSDNERFEIGVARTLREGTDCVIMTTGGILEEVQTAADFLNDAHINAKILSVHTIKPIDENAILDACKHARAVITVEEHTVSGGLGGVVAETLMDHSVFPEKFLRIGLDSGFSSIVGSQKYLRCQYGLDAKSIFKRIQNLMSQESDEKSI